MIGRDKDNIKDKHLYEQTRTIEICQTLKKTPTQNMKGREDNTDAIDMTILHYSPVNL